MVIVRLPKILIFLSRGKIFFFEPGNLSKALNIPDTFVKDLEVVDPEGLSSWIGAFLDKEKIDASEVLIVISEAVSFVKDIPFSDESKKAVLVQDFIDSVPLEFPEVKVFRTDEVDKVIAVNSKYYQVLVELLTSKGFAVLAVIPGSVVPGIGAASEMSSGVAKKILESFEKLRFQSFIDSSVTETQVSAPIITTGKPKGTRIYVLVGIFVLGIIVLLALLLFRK